MNTEGAFFYYATWPPVYFGDTPGGLIGVLIDFGRLWL
jgi:hypothetical protein